MRFTVKSPDEVKVLVILDEIIVDEIMTYNINYMNNIKSLFDEIDQSKKRAWVRLNNIKITRHTSTVPNSLLVKVTNSAELTEQQATEYYLRF